MQKHRIAVPVHPCRKAVRRSVLLLAALLLIGMFGGCASERTVGKQISPDKITEFYYTYDTSTNPPHFQRYRFYTENGAYRFYHETREGDHWPLREADITVSGTLDLTEVQWNTFLTLLDGGTVRSREANVSSDGSGLWLYLYWKGDRGKDQAFSFASYALQSDFESLCLSLKNAELAAQPVA